jgi:1-acyl-sn-glycerol-3-phosphate acyltransferase
MNAKVVGPLLERAGCIRVDRGSDDARHAMTVTDSALANKGHIVVYPEGRIGLDRDLWPERGRSGVARMALRSRVPVIPVSSWGAHEVLCYADDRRKLNSFARALWQQPLMKVHVGTPVPLDDLVASRMGDANRARERIIAAITMQLQVLRRSEPGRPRHLDLTRPCPEQSTAAFPGGIVPEHLRTLITAARDTP